MKLPGLKVHNVGSTDAQPVNFYQQHILINFVTYCVAYVLCIVELYIL